MSKIYKTAIVEKNVTIGKNVIIEDFCIIGKYPGQSSFKNTNIGNDSIIRSGTYIYNGNKIGINFSTGNKVNIREDNIIKDNVSIGTLTNIEHNIFIGNNVRIHSQAFIPEFSKIEDNAWIGPNVVLTNALYPNNKNSKKNLKGPKICVNAKIGANVTILPGLTIGENSLVGAGSIITKDVPDNVVVIGTKGVIINKVENIYD